jgi:hypothetical protein
MRDENSASFGSDRQNAGIGNPCKSRRVRGQEIDRRFPSQTSGDDGVMEAGVREEADHALPSRRLQWSRTLELFFQIGRRWMSVAERIFQALASREILVNFVSLSQIEGDGAVDLLQS